MSNPKTNLVWVDLEMTGLDPQRDHIIEIACIVTDAQLNVIVEAPVLVIHQPDSVLDHLDDWNCRQHSQSGLLDRVRSSTLSVEEVEEQMLNFLKQYADTGYSPMCGNSICQDRRFMARSMPRLEKFFHYRNLDVSTIKELVSRWYPEKIYHKISTHQALQDIRDSIAELQYYRQTIFIAG